MYSSYGVADRASLYDSVTVNGFVLKFTGWKTLSRLEFYPTVEQKQVLVTPIWLCSVGTKQFKQTQRMNSTETGKGLSQIGMNSYPVLKKEYEMVKETYKC